MRLSLLGFRVRAFVAGEGWREDKFELRQAAIDCAKQAGEGAIVHKVTQWTGDEEEYETIWPDSALGGWDVP